MGSSSRSETAATNRCDQELCVYWDGEGCLCRRPKAAAAEREHGPDSWEGDTAVWSIADARTTVLLHGASTVGREIELAVESYDGSVRLTDDQATRVADALRAAATWRQK